MDVVCFTVQYGLHGLTTAQKNVLRPPDQSNVVPAREGNKGWKGEDKKSKETEYGWNRRKHPSLSPT